MPLAPSAARADTNLTIGGKATIVNANGDRVRLRSAPGYDASVVTMLAEGDVVTVENSPVTASDGSLWYEVVTSDGFDGYLDSNYLQLADGSTAASDSNGAQATDITTTDNSQALTPTADAQGGSGNDASGAVTPTTNTGDQSQNANANATTPPDASQTDGSAATDTPTDVQTPNVAETSTTGAQDQNSGITPTDVPQEPTVTATTAEPTQAATETATTPSVSSTADTGSAETPTTAPATTETPTTVPETVEPPTIDTGAGTAPTTTAENPATSTPEATGTTATHSTPDTGATATATSGADNGVTPTASTAATPTTAATAPATATTTATATATTSSTVTATATTGTTPAPSATTTTAATPTTAPVTPTSTSSVDNTDVLASAPPRVTSLLQPQTKANASGLPAATGIIAGTNGDGVRCRATPDFNGAIITVLPEGTKVPLNGGLQGDWQPVNCAGQAGYVYIQYIATGGDASNGGSGGSSGGGTTVTGNAVVSGTGGDGVRCRTDGSTSAAVIMVLAEGTSVQLRGSAQNGWQPVFCGGQSGWVSSQYLSTSSSSGGSNSGSSSGGGSSVTGSAVVSGTGGDGVRCRSDANTSSSIIVVLPEGQQVDLRGSAQNGWQPVFCAGQSGWVFSQYLSSGGSSSGGNNGGSTGGNSGGNSSFPAGSTATVTGTGGTGVNLRSSGSLSASVITVVPEGASVQVRSGSSASWIAVTYNGSNGFISASYLSAGGGGGNNGGGNNGGGNTGGGLSVGDHAQTTDSLNLRYSASLSAGVAAVAPAGTVVQITSGLSNGFYGVSWDGLNGYMYGQYLQATNAPLSSRGGSGNPSGGGNTGGNAGSGGGTASGQSIVNYALQYVGYPYVWAAAGPSSFDCSGFTEWVYLHTMGIDITHDLYQQYSGGTPVAYGNLQPGDLVFYQNTFEFGLSHVGIYIGNNQMVNAENESTGVVVSDITGSYWQQHWYGAVRYAN